MSCSVVSQSVSPSLPIKPADETVVLPVPNDESWARESSFDFEATLQRGSALDVTDFPLITTRFSETEMDLLKAVFSPKNVPLLTKNDHAMIVRWIEGDHPAFELDGFTDVVFRFCEENDAALQERIQECEAIRTICETFKLDVPAIPDRFFLTLNEVNVLVEDGAGDLKSILTEVANQICHKDRGVTDGLKALIAAFPSLRNHIYIAAVESLATTSHRLDPILQPLLNIPQK